MIRFTSHGDFSKTTKFLELMQSGKIYSELDKYGRVGRDALARSSPKDTGRMAQSWGYQVEHAGSRYSISWFNTNREGGINVAIIVQYGHGTGTGGYVVGRDYINPVMQPLFDKMANDIWRQVVNG